MKSLFQFLSRWRNLLLLFFLFVLFNGLLNSILPKKHALDLMFAYSADDAYAALAQLDRDQLSVYSVGIWVLDMPYIVIYGLLFTGLLLKIWKRTVVVWLPLGIATMDLFENLSISRILYLFPLRQEFLVTVASFFTTSKWTMVGFLVLSIFCGLISSIAYRKRFFAKSAGLRI
ncbi:hypothetical protein J0A67_04065 [Algoriphagus aestuariicola]|uniref:Uncharacterized protein n=1 Tax=Algoriphagus aestuariicola TaxID=1852016 RepID=A0ABS3BL46_9BACT|nr:hypothetical protein [Algoriphagus aestuariicola]MBN7800021.1 hypothetical protein [Algoriphagus aestuariicola]